MQDEHGKGEFICVHNFYVLRKKERFKRNVGLLAGDAVSPLLVLIFVSTRFLTKVELGLRANLQREYLETDVELCRWNKTSSPAETAKISNLCFEARKPILTNLKKP